MVNVEEEEEEGAGIDTREVKRRENMTKEAKEWLMATRRFPEVVRDVVLAGMRMRQEDVKGREGETVPDK